MGLCVPVETGMQTPTELAHQPMGRWWKTCELPFLHPGQPRGAPHPTTASEAHSRHWLAACNAPSPVTRAVRVLSLRPPRGQSGNVLVINLLLPHHLVKRTVWGVVTTSHFHFSALRALITSSSDKDVSLALVASAAFQELKLLPPTLAHSWYLTPTDETHAASLTWGHSLPERPQVMRSRLLCLFPSKAAPRRGLL